MSVLLGVDGTTKWQIYICSRYERVSLCVLQSISSPSKWTGSHRSLQNIKRAPTPKFTLTLNFYSQAIINTKDLLSEKFNSLLILPNQ